MDILIRMLMAVLKDRKHKKQRRVLSTVLAAVVVFMTTYSLILPAITLEESTAETTDGIFLESADVSEADPADDDVDPSGELLLTDDAREESAQASDGWEDGLIEDADWEENGELADIPDEPALTDTGDETEEAAETETGNVYAETEEATEDTTESEESVGEGETESELEEQYPEVEFSDSTQYTQVKVYAPEGAFPEGTQMLLSDVEDDETIAAICDAALAENSLVQKVHAVDISFRNSRNEEIEPLLPIRVEMTAEKCAEVGSSSVSSSVVHVDDSGNATIVENAQKVEAEAEDEKDADKLEDVETIAFEAKEFSVYALVYTVDFHWEVDGQMYEFSLPGGGFISFSDLIEVLGVAKTGENDDVYLPGEVPGINDQDATGENGSAALTLDGVVVSEKTREFVADVKSVVFSSPELVDVSKVESETTVGGIKESRGLDVQYSAELTEEQIAEINAQTVVAGDWALISVQPFESTESLTVTMKTGEVFEIRVTDAQLKKTVKTASGETWEITITYDDSAEIPKDAELRVEEILPEDERYEQYYQQSLEKISVGEVPDTIEDESGSEMIDETAETASEEAATTTSYAHIFDIQIWAGDQQIEPASGSTVSVSIKLLDAPENEDTNLQVVHFGKDGLEVMELAENNDETKAGGTELNFVTDEFSVYAIVGTETLTGGFVAADGSTYEVTVTYDADAGIPKDSSLELVEYTEDSKEYQEAKIKIDEFKANELAVDGEDIEDEAADSEETEDEEQYGFSALGISIIGPDGNEVEPKSEVKVSIVMKSLPVGFEAEDIQQTIEVHHLAESEGNITVEKVAAPVLEGSEITADDNGASVEFTTSSFSTYTVTWGNRNKNTTTLHFVDESGNELTGVKYNGNTIDNRTISLTDLLSNYTTLDLRSAFTVDGKTLSNTHINSIANLGTGNARQIVANEIRREGNNFRYRTFNENGDDSGSSWNTIANNSNLYLVYSDVPGGGGGGGTTPDDPDAPDFGTIGNSKVKTDNGNGTYKLNLSVTGQAQSASANNHVNVLIVLDTSSSMTSNGRTRLADAKRALVGTTQAEIEASICHKLLSNNTTDDPNIVQLAFVTFAGSADYHSFGSSYWTTNEATFRTEVNGVGTASGTNWEDAMKYAATVVAAADSDPTYVIFLTDGQPSRYWRGGNPSQYVDGEGCMLAACDEARALRRDYGTEIYGIFAWGSNDNFTKDYLGKMIGYAYNNNDVISSHRFNGQDSAQLVSDLEKILNIISLNFGFADVTFNDGITGLTSTDVSLATVEDDSFEYTITYVDAQDGQTHTVAATKNDDGTVSIPSVTYNVQDRDNPGQYKSKTTEAVTVTGAEYIDGRVIWHIEQTESTDPYILEEAWTYTVSFDIWPSQHAYDLVAALNNDPSIWGQSYTFVDDDSTITYEQYLAQISGGPNGPFELKTNTDANVTYKQVTAKTVDGVTTYEYSDPIEVPVSYTGGMSLTSEDMTVEKQWYNPLDSRPVEDEVELSVTLDNKEFLSHIILDSEHDYKHEVFIACGIITEDDDGYEIKETGHDFTFAEVHDENTFYWNLEAEVYRPMLINGKLNLLIKQDSAEGADYVIGGNYYKKGPEGAASISATNVRRSRLNLRKFVTDETDGTVDPDADFTYTITINEANDEDVYFSVFGTNGAQYLTPEQGVIVSNNVTPQMMQDDSGEHQYYYVPAGKEFTVNAKAGWSLMFLNLSNGTTYTISESMPAGFELGGEEGSANEYYYATPGDPSSRTTRPVAHNMKFNGVTTSGTITQSNTQYRVDYTNVWKSKDVTLIKVKEDGQTEIGEAVFDIAKKNAAGRFVSVGTFTSSTDDEALGEVFKLGYGIYCLTETKAPDGYIILTNKIYFNLTTDGIVLSDENGDAATYDNAVVSGEDLLTVTVKNTPGAALPNTGGSGTFPYTLGGMMLIIASALMYGFRMRRRERRLN